MTKQIPQESFSDPAQDLKKKSSLKSLIFARLEASYEAWRGAKINVMAEFWKKKIYFFVMKSPGLNPDSAKAWIQIELFRIRDILFMKTFSFKLS